LAESVSSFTPSLPKWRRATFSSSFFGSTCTPSGNFSVKSAICAMTWFVKLELITKLGWPGGAAEVHEAPAREHDELLAVREDEVIDLRLDVLLADAGRGLEVAMSISLSKCPMLQRIASFFITLKCSRARRRSSRSPSR
jgi:hypothetical protein